MERDPGPNVGRGPGDLLAHLRRGLGDLLRNLRGGFAGGLTKTETPSRNGRAPEGARLGQRCRLAQRCGGPTGSSGRRRLDRARPAGVSSFTVGRPLQG